MFNNIPELLHTNSFQYSATKYAFRALTSGYIDCDCLIHVKSHTLKSITGKNIKLKTEPEEIYSSLVSHLSKITHDQPSKDLDHNCQLLANGLALPRNSWRFLKLMTVIDSNGGLKLFLQEILSCDSNMNPIFASMVNIEEQELITIINAMNSLGVFERICLISLEFLWLPQPIVNKLLGTKVNDYFELIAPIIQSQDASALRLKDFEHLSPDTMVKFVDIALNNSIPGINILLYGAPGCGKSEFSKVVADKTGAALVAIRAIGDDAHNLDDQLHTNSTSSSLRLQYHQLVQRLTPKSDKCILLMDECEDIFDQGFSNRGLGKGMLHRLLEQNEIVTIWISNHLESIPNSCIRRFTFVQHVEVPDNRIMENIIDTAFKGLYVSRDFKQKLAENKDVVPAHITNAGFVSHCVEQRGKEAENTISTLVNSKLIACGHDINPAKYRPQLAFSTEFLNIRGGNQAIEQIAKAVNKNSDIRVLLTGESGTGKTAAVYHFAEQANRELITVRCSDVISKYIGESEKNIKNIFKQATENASVLLFDEIDSLLLDRSGLTQSWEIQQVNELLTQLECFTEPFFASTNYSARLDKAMARRFDFKLEFQHLASPQVLKLYNRLLGGSAYLDELPHDIKTELDKLTLLAPGDFAIVARRERIKTKPLSHDERLHILKAENDRKQTTKAIGFVR